jgi:peptide chain release factor 2
MRLESLAAEPDFWDKPNAARDIIGQTNAQRVILKPFLALNEAIEEIGVLLELAGAEAESDQRRQGLEEASAGVSRAESLVLDLELKSLLSGELDGSNAYLTLHAGAGGTESCDWADMMLRMYRRYCENQEFDLEVMEYSPGDEAGLKSVTFLVSGPYAYGYLKAERGVHRLVRISPFDANKRRHTSFAALDVVAEVADDIDVEVKEEDLRIDTYRSSGAGGQHVNTTDSAVRLTHLPTGIVVACQAERSQHKNRAKAFKILKAKLYEWHLDQKKQEMERFYGKKGEIAWGSQIRSYVMQPYTMVKDHRTGEETANVGAVLDGAIQPFIEAYLRKAASRQVENGGM